MNFKINIIFAICLIVAVQVSAAPTYDEFERLFDQVFGSQAEQLSVDQTSTQLKRMIKVYETRPQKSGSEIEPIKSLVALTSDISDDNCVWEFINAMNLLIESQSIFVVNIVPYLAHYRREQFDICAEKFENELESEVDNVFDEYLEDMTNLRKDILGTGVGQVDALPLSSYVSGIVKFLERKLGPIESGLSLERFGLLMVNNVWPVCGSTKVDLEPLIKNYEQLLDDDQLKAKMTPFILDWIDNVRICRRVMKEFGSIASESIIILRSA